MLLSFCPPHRQFERLTDSLCCLALTWTGCLMLQWETPVENAAFKHKNRKI